MLNIVSGSLNLSHSHLSLATVACSIITCPAVRSRLTDNIVVLETLLLGLSVVGIGILDELTNTLYFM